MKTPEEIKKALECCARMTGCAACPYVGDKCALKVSVDTLEYIQQLEQIIADFTERTAQRRKTGRVQPWNSPPPPRKKSEDHPWNKMNKLIKRREQE